MIKPRITNIDYEFTGNEIFCIKGYQVQVKNINHHTQFFRTN